MTERSITLAWAWIWVYKPLQFTSLALLNHSRVPFSGEAGIPSCIWYHLNLSPSSPCAMSLSIPSPRSRQHNCKHIYYTLESHAFPPHISSYCVAPVFCFHFLRTSNKALISFKERGGELVPPSSKFSGRSHRGNAGSLGRYDTITPHQRGKIPYEVLSADGYGVFSTIRKVAISFGWLLWNDLLVVGCWVAVCIPWDGVEGPKTSAGKVVRIPKVKMAENHCLVKSHIMGLMQERNPLVILVPIIKHLNL